MRNLIKTGTFGLALALALPAAAVTRLIGDVDGFGYSSALLVGARAANGGLADVDGDGVVEAGEFLIDFNRNGSVAIGSGDDFDNRSDAELAAADGAQHTDFAIVGQGTSNGRQFVFTFPVPVPGDIDFGVDHFINFVFGDYDVVPATLSVDGVVVALTQQSNGSGQDGLVQSAFATVPWSKMTDGIVVIEVIAPAEPYLAFDYALLDTDEFADCDLDSVPDPLDNCPCDANADQSDIDGDGDGDVCDACPGDADNDADGDTFCADDDNCPTLSNVGQEDADQDGYGDVCDDCTDVDHDSVCDELDLCPGTVFPDLVPTVSLGVNRFADLDGDGFFDTVSPKGKGPRRSYSIDDTAGCSCSQIIDALDLGDGHVKHGCSISAMDDWTALVSQP